MSRFYRPLLLSLALAGLAAATPYSSERPGGAGSDPLDQPRDLTGRSIKTPRVRAVHDRVLPGSSGWLMEHDPWLAYQRGRELSLREFDGADGAFGDSGRLAGKVLDDGCTPIMSRDHINSCVACHNSPWRDMGAGINIQKNSGAGRNTPHLFGTGQVEMIGEEIRRQLLAQSDSNHNGWIELSEAHGAARVVPTAGAEPLDFGSFADEDGDGRPDLNPVVYVWYMDAQGKRIPWARNLKAPNAAGYGIEVQVFGFGQRDRIGHGGLGSTVRHVSSNAWDMHSGLQAHDPTASSETNQDGLCRVSLAGAQQFFTGFTRDAGTVLGPHGISLDDPDRDGVVEEISEGDMDLVEWFLLNHPAPAQQGGDRFQRGSANFQRIGCEKCHQSDWDLPKDRRFFDLSVEPDGHRLKGKVKLLHGGPLRVKGVFSDFRHHDMGAEMYETQYDGSQTRKFRTSPLWGVGSSAPYGHDGADLSLDGAIRRHGGEGGPAAERYAGLSEAERDDLLAFLQGLVLYSTETLATDVDGDGQISPHFLVAGEDTGKEVFNPEWLFVHPGQIEGNVQSPEGRTIVSRALTNLEEAYGMLLIGLKDSDADGFPDCCQKLVSGKLQPFRAVGKR